MEQPLISNSACNLGSIDVSKFYANGEFDWIEFKSVIDDAVKFLNNTIDINDFPLKEIETTVKKYRPIGLGLMGVADLFIKMKMKYGEEDSLWFAEELAKTLYETAKISSEKHALENHNSENTTLISYAPTGTISMFAGCSSGIEPNFAFKYNRRTWVNGEENKFIQYHPLYEEYKNSINLPDYFVTTMEIAQEKHIKMQSVFQKYCDSGISKTINIPNDATKENVGDLIFQAWKSGCKGFTMYRDGSRKFQVLSTENENEIKKENVKEIEISKKRPSILSGTTYKKYSGCGKLYVTVNEKDGKPYEVIVQTSGIGGCAANTEAIGRAISAGLRNGVPAIEYIRQLNRVICPKCKNGSKVDGKSCADIIGKCLSLGIDFEIEKTKEKDKVQINKVNILKCPECGEEIFMMEGCITCPSCGYSKCS